MPALAARIKVENGRKKSRSDPFRFLLSSIRFCISGIRFRIYGNGKGGFSSVSARCRFYPKLTRIYSVFHLVFNLCEICLEIDMFINLLIINYAC